MEENIHAAINAIMKEVGYVQKTKAGGLKYTFAGEAALIQALRPAMVEHGVYCRVSEVRNVRRERYQSKDGTNMVNTCLEATIAFVHAPSGTEVLVETAGEGADSGDKSQNKALTGAYKYALRQTFCIETGDDPDSFQEGLESANKQVKEVLKRNWSAEQTEAVSLYVLDNSEPGTAIDKDAVVAVLDLSVLPENASPKTVASWFKHYFAAEGNEMQRATVANEAYIKAKKSK